MGNKIQNGIRIPSWINKNIQFQKSFLRGLFDTDGCIYLDKHKIKNKTYKHMGWVITSASPKFISDIINLLKNLGYSPTNRTSQKSVFLRKQNEIIKYFTTIGTNNKKHLNRYLKFKQGRVPKWS